MNARLYHVFTLLVHIGNLKGGHWGSTVLGNTGEEIVDSAIKLECMEYCAEQCKENISILVCIRLLLLKYHLFASFIFSFP